MRAVGTLSAVAAALMALPALAQDVQDPHAGHDMSAMQGMEGMDHSGHDMGAMDAKPEPEPVAPATPPPMDHSAHTGHAMPASPVETIGAAPPPPVPTDHPADAFWDKARMDRARKDLSSEGRFTGSALIADRLEYRAGKGRDGYSWQAMGWTGGDVDRLAFETEGEGTFRGKVESAEVRAAWRHALDPWWNLEIGARQDFAPGPDRTYAVVGIEGLAPYWFEIGAHAFVSNTGDVHFRLEAEHDMRLTQRLVLQPSVEINAAAQDVPELGIGRGLETIELGARLRYEIVREFAPYVGIHWERKLGKTARLSRAAGDSPSVANAVVGIRMWF